jgi:hypothetical protein
MGYCKVILTMFLESEASIIRLALFPLGLGVMVIERLGES